MIIVAWELHVDEGLYGMILGRDLLTVLVLSLNFFKKGIKGVDGPYKGCTYLIVDMCTYEHTI